MQYHEYPEDFFHSASPATFYQVQKAQTHEESSLPVHLHECISLLHHTDNSVIDSLNKQGQHFFYKARRNMKECKISDCTT